MRAGEGQRAFHHDRAWSEGLVHLALADVINEAHGLIHIHGGHL